MSKMGDWHVYTMRRRASDGTERDYYKVVDLGADGYPRFTLATISPTSDAAEIAAKMAAADEMLQALIGLLRFAPPITHHDVAAYNRARAAVARARGDDHG